MNKNETPQKEIDTDGGTYIEGDVEVRDGDVVGRDQHLHGDEVRGDKIVQIVRRVFVHPSDAKRALRDERNRQVMIHKVADFWIKGVLERSLYQVAKIKLGLAEQPDAVDRPWDSVLQTETGTDLDLSDTKISDIFDRAGGSLLILGEPGSGKTILLLELARDAIRRAKADPAQPIPVVFHLSSWSRTRQPLVDWLAEEMSTKYYIPVHIARPWIEKDELVLFLDGLDEVDTHHRAACIVAINEFLRQHMVSTVVCSRVQEYELAAQKLRLQKAIRLKPLTRQQIERYLEGKSDELLIVRQALQRDTGLQDLARSPLMLSIIARSYRGETNGHERTLEVEARRKHLLDTYVQRMLEQRSKAAGYSPQATVNWLSWLAERMLEHNESVFLVERLQTSWLPSDRQRVAYRITVGLFSGLLGGIFGGLLHSLLYGFFGMYYGGLLAGSVGGLFVAFVSGLGGGLRRSIRPVEVLRLSWRRALAGLVPGLFAGLVWTAVYGRIYGWMAGLFGGLICGLVIGLFSGLLRGLGYDEIGVRTRPNQGIRLSAKNAIVSGAVFGLALGLIIGLLVGTVTGLAVIQSYGLRIGLRLGAYFGLAFGSVFGSLGALTSGMLFGGRAVVQHLVLRLALRLEGCFPWRCVRFLDFAAGRILLRQVGGGYVFVHRLLAEHLAGKWESQHTGHA